MVEFDDDEMRRTIAVMFCVIHIELLIIQNLSDANKQDRRDRIINDFILRNEMRDALIISQ